MFLWSWISVEALPFGLNEKEELRNVSSAKGLMLEDVEASRSFMKRMKSTGEMTEPWGYTSIDGVQIREEAIHSDGNRPIRSKAINSSNKPVMKTKHW